MGRFERRQRGTFIVIVAVGAFFLLGMAGLAVDAIYLYMVKGRLVTALDASALGAARSLGKGQPEASRVVNMLFDSNFPEDTLLAIDVGHSEPFITSPAPGRREIRLTGFAVVPTIFMRIFGWDDIRIEGSSRASRRDVNVMLVLDRSGSLDRAPGLNPGPTAFDDLKNAASEFVGRFDDTRDKVGVVSFGSGSHVDFSPATGFKGPVNAVIEDLFSDNSGTNGSDGLWKGYQELVALNEPGVLNVIVFFTDGVATHFSGEFQTNGNPPGGCGNTDVEGVIGTESSPGSDYAIGLTVIDPGPPPVLEDQVDWIPGCDFSMDDVRESVPLLPLANLHGTPVQGWKSIPYWSGGQPVTRGLNIKPIAENLTVNTAKRIRTDPNLETTIFGIGLGGETNNFPADHELMRRVANDPAAMTFTDSEPEGLYVFAPSPVQLNQAFSRVASEIFRLIQ